MPDSLVDALARTSNMRGQFSVSLFGNGTRTRIIGTYPQVRDRLASIDSTGCHFERVVIRHSPGERLPR